MRPFIKQFFMFIAPILLVGGIFELLLRQAPTSYSIKNDYLEQNAESVQTLILGSSHVYKGLDPALFTSSTFNAANSAQSFKYDLAIYEKFAPRFHSLKQIILSVSYVSLWTDLDLLRPELSREYKAYFGLGAYKSVWEPLDITHHKMRRNLNILFNHYILHKEGTSPLGWRKAPLRKGGPSLEMLAAAASARHIQYIQENPNRDKTFSETTFALTEFMADCARKGIDVYLIKTPKHISYQELAPEYYVQKSDSVFHAWDNQFPHVTYLNWANLDGFPDSDFKDADHLSKPGTIKLSAKLDAIIESKQAK